MITYLRIPPVSSEVEKLITYVLNVCYPGGHTDPFQEELVQYRYVQFVKHNLRDPHHNHICNCSYYKQYSYRISGYVYNLQV